MSAFKCSLHANDVIQEGRGTPERGQCSGSAVVYSAIVGKRWSCGVKNGSPE